MLSEGLAAVDRSGFSEFVGTPLIASTDPYRPPAKLYACQLVDLAARLMHDPADKLDSVLQSYNASHDKSLDQAKRFFWSDVYRAAADHMASPDCIEIARSILHDPTRLFVEQAKHILSKNWTAAVIDHAFSLLMKHPWTTSKESEFDVAVKKALLSSRATPVRLAADSAPSCAMSAVRENDPDGTHEPVTAPTTDCAARYARKSASPWLHLRNHSSDAFDRFRESCAARSGLGADDARLFAMDAGGRFRSGPQCEAAACKAASSARFLRAAGVRL